MIRTFNPIQRWAKSLHRLVFLAIGLVVMAQVWGVNTSPAIATGIYDMPSLTVGTPTWVVDDADILSRLTESKISGELEKLAQDTGNEVRFITIHRFDYGETADGFAEKLFQKWFPTPEAQANQTLLLLDNVTNNSAIYTGDGTRALLTDDIATSVAQETLLEPLRNGNKYNQAFMDASDRLVAVLSGNPDPGPPVIEKVVQTEGTFTPAEETDDQNATVVVVVLLLLATVIPMATYYLYQSFSG
ncbi:TPM domain-containing protein [Oculatella sp. LEGE 06141]|uniref:photosystem II repair protein Psb32 n=1 Tax=Oculatella sp. LEGE 06141 TaxID=1828648 RepID=UPI001882B0DE|nr:TPM domain-containing protein [Oculatella sp. LEGE 06141]MBE9176984.1 TPM domain-containing protein [Oculatella sp. LEGE 06141]